LKSSASPSIGRWRKSSNLKREVSTGGVRVYSRLTETRVSESVNLREEHASIDRRPVDRPATAADLKEGFVEVRETAEEPVIAKTARVIEEVVVGKESTTRTETVNDTVRGTNVEVERMAGEDIPRCARTLRQRRLNNSLRLRVSAAVGPPVRLH